MAENGLPKGVVIRQLADAVAGGAAEGAGSIWEVRHKRAVYRVAAADQPLVELREYWFSSELLINGSPAKDLPHQRIVGTLRGPRLGACEECGWELDGQAGALFVLGLLLGATLALKSRPMSAVMVWQH